MAVKLLFAPRASFGGGVAKLFDDYASMKEYVEGYLNRRAKKCVERTEFKDSWSMDRLPENLKDLLVKTLPEDHQRKIDNYKHPQVIETRYIGTPVIKIGDEKPLVIRTDDRGFDRNEIRYHATLPVEVRLKYTTREGEVKEPGQPYVPPHEKDHVSKSFVVYSDGAPYHAKYSLGEGKELYQHCYANGSVALVTDEDEE
ncbi:hypothetical protein C4565_00420 [Candidatus Parcubacteria bacterium]|nr:MAG: hypothetical protein C4565_00420 [Candidatus Parcubacteria bacterium]